MTRKVKSEKLKVAGFVFWLGSAQLLTIALLFAYPLLIGGCNEKKADISGADRVQVIPAEEKKADLLKLLDLKFENPDAHFKLAQLYQAEGLWSKAEYHYRITLSFDPVHRRAQAAMVKVFLDSGNTAKAKTYADIYMNQVAGSASGLLRLGVAFWQQQLDEYALACYQQALDLAPDSAEIHRQMGYYYLGKNDKVRAKEYLSRSFQLDPKQPDVAGELGRLGVEVRIPRKIESPTEEAEKIAERSGEEKK